VRESSFESRTGYSAAELSWRRQAIDAQWCCEQPRIAPEFC